MSQATQFEMLKVPWYLIPSDKKVKQIDVG